MRTNPFAAVILAVAALAAPVNAHAWVVVRAAPVYYAPRPVVVVAPVPVYVAPAPVYLPPQPPPSLLTTKLPLGTNISTLPNGCNSMTVNGQPYYQCGVNWMKAFGGPTGIYFSVVPPP